MIKKFNWQTIFFLAVTTIGTLVGTPIYMWHFGVSFADVILFASFFITTSMGITVGYHRLFSHTSYKTNRLMRFIVLFFGAAAFQQSALTWASTHRDHHRHADTDLDPYGIHKGFFYAHIGWMLFYKHDPDFANVADLRKDALIRHQHRFYHAWAFTAGVLLPVAIGASFGHAGGAFLMAVCARIALVHHATFCINSFAHMFGDAPHDKHATARDNWFMALITNGEGWHNFHHRHPSDYRNGIRWYHWDPSKWTIAFLAWLGMAWDLKRASSSNPRNS